MDDGWRDGYPFDPTHGYDLEELLGVQAPPEPEGFASFWSSRYARAVALDPAPTLSPSDHVVPGMAVWDVEHTSTDGFPIRGWLLEPTVGPVRFGFVVGHGYGGRDAPDVPLLRPDAAYYVPCFRGLGRSAREPISTDPCWHVLHDLHRAERYIVGGCVEDVWTSVSALLALWPSLVGRVGYLGASFGGGVGAMAMAWDPRIVAGHLDVPTFGHQPLRLRLPSTGSAAAVQRFVAAHPGAARTLALFDAAVAARRITQPVHVAAALFDPVVAPAGQFAVANALGGPRQLFVRTAGHVEHPDGPAEAAAITEQLRTLFRGATQRTRVAVGAAR